VHYLTLNHVVMRQIEERFRVKPKLSLTSKDLYKRYKMNNLSIPEPGESDYNMSDEIADMKRMSKTKQLSKMKEGQEQINNLKAKLENGGK